MLKYIQIRHWDYWWCAYGINEGENLSAVEFSITEDKNGEELFFHLDLYTLAGLEHPEGFMEPDTPEYLLFLDQANRLRNGEIDYFIGGLYYRNYTPNLEQCNQFLQTGQSIFDVKAPQQSPYYAVIFLREREPLMPPLLIRWLERLSVPLFQKTMQFEIANVPSEAEARRALEGNEP